MREAIKNFIDIQIKNIVPLNKIEDEIIKIERAEIQKVRKRQYREWRKLNKIK